MFAIPKSNKRFTCQLHKKYLQMNKKENSTLNRKLGKKIPTGGVEKRNPLGEVLKIICSQGDAKFLKIRCHFLYIRLQNIGCMMPSVMGLWSCKSLLVLLAGIQTGVAILEYNLAPLTQISKHTEKDPAIPLLVYIPWQLRGP